MLDCGLMEGGDKKLKTRNIKTLSQSLASRGKNNGVRGGVNVGFR